MLPLTTRSTASPHTLCLEASLVLDRAILLFLPLSWNFLFAEFDFIFLFPVVLSVVVL